MLLTELIPLIKELSHTDKLLLIHFLAAELLKESSLVPLDAEDKVASFVLPYEIGLRLEAGLKCMVSLKRDL